MSIRRQRARSIERRTNYCEALVLDEGDVTNIMDEFQKTCDEPATIKHGGHWFCEFHYELFFTLEEQQ